MTTTTTIKIDIPSAEIEITAENTVNMLHQVHELIDRAVIAIRPANIDPGDFEILNDHTHELEILGEHMAACTGTREMAEFSAHGPDCVEPGQMTLTLTSDVGALTATKCTRGALTLLTSIVGNGWATDSLLMARGVTELKAFEAVRSLAVVITDLATLLQRRKPRPA